jgi:hypothetical protein
LDAIEATKKNLTTKKISSRKQIQIISKKCILSTKFALFMNILIKLTIIVLDFVKKLTILVIIEGTRVKVTKK